MMLASCAQPAIGDRQKRATNAAIRRTRRTRDLVSMTRASFKNGDGPMTQRDEGCSCPALNGWVAGTERQAGRCSAARRQRDQERCRSRCSYGVLVFDRRRDPYLDGGIFQAKFTGPGTRVWRAVLSLRKPWRQHAQ